MPLANHRSHGNHFIVLTTKSYLIVLRCNNCTERVTNYFRPTMRSGSSVILMALAVTDTLTLTVGPTGMYLQRIYNISINDYFLICKLHRFVKSVFGYSANWLVVVFTVFRVIAVYLPHKANVYCTRRRAFIAVVVTLATSSIVNLDPIIYVQYVIKNNRRKCWFTGSRYIYYTVYSQWVMLTIMSVIPFIMLIISNILIIYKVLFYSFRRRNMSTEIKSNDSQSMTAILVGISVLFLVTQVPAVVISIIKRNLSTETHSKEYVYIFLVIDTIFRLLKWSNHAVNFFCYCVSGKRFREELVAMVTGRFRRKQGCDGTAVTKTSTVTTSLSNTNM